MTKVRTFSRVFPKGHPREGQETFFVEKIWKWYYNHYKGDIRDLLWYNEQFDNLYGVDAIKNIHKYKAKKHTIRGGKHFKAGDVFSPRVWHDKPYRSKQLEIMPNTEIKRVYDFKIEVEGDYICLLIDNGTMVTQLEALETLAQNDGLSLQDFKDWFKWGTPFDGQIISWCGDEGY